MGDSQTIRRKSLGMAGLALAVLSFIPHLGLLFLPAALVNVAALVRRSSRVLALIGLLVTCVRSVGAAVRPPALPHGTPSFLYRPYAGLILTNYRLPPVPARATRIRLSAGGLFAKNVFLVFDAPEPAVMGFLKGLGGGEARRVGPSGCRVVTYEGMARISEQAFAEGREPDLSSVVCMPVHDWLPWFRPDSITVGWIACRANQDVTGFTLLYDSQRPRAYVHWHYS